MADPDVDAVAMAAAAALPMRGTDADYRPLLDAIGDASFCLLGECTHGTQEFYEHRAAITKALVETKGFSIVLVEGDWPAAHRLNRYVTGADQTDSSAEAALSGFEGFPKWMWRNGVTASLAEDLKQHNERVQGLRAEHAGAQDTVNAMRAAGATDAQLEEMGFTPVQRAADPPMEAHFYGMDTYSVNASARRVVDFLEAVDPEAADVAKARYAPLTPFADEMKKYGAAVVVGELQGQSEEIQHALLATLADLQRANRGTYDALVGPAELLDAEQNAQVVVNGEAYFRGLWEEHGGGGSTWNLRDQHMVQTCLRLVEYHQMLGDGKPPKVVLWAHNSHVGDARATDRGNVEELNLGQCIRSTFGSSNAFLVGFGTHSGTVTAASEWGGEAQTFELSEAEPGSYSDLLHTALPIARDRLGPTASALNALMLLLHEDLDPADETLRELRAAFAPARRQRAIGVRYQKEREGLVHYMQCSLSQQFDAWIHVDVTRALEPLAVS